MTGPPEHLSTKGSFKRMFSGVHRGDTVLVMMRRHKLKHWRNMDHFVTFETKASLINLEMSTES